MTSHRNSSNRIFWGLLLIVAGVLLLLDRIGRLDFGDLLSSYWPLLLIVAWLWHIMVNKVRKTAGGIVLIIVGCFFMLGKWDILGRSAWHFIWPLLIILAGLWILFGSFLRGAARKSAGEKADDIDEFAMFSGLTRRFESQALRGGEATVVLGGMELDFSRAQLAGGQASIKVTAVLGGLEIKVPKNWQVHVESHPVLGSIENGHSYLPGQESQQVLTITATAILAGIEIKDAK